MIITLGRHPGPLSEVCADRAAGLCVREPSIHKSATGATPASTTDFSDCANRNSVSATDDALFAPYQPLHGEPYDLTCQFGRTNMALRIRRCIDNREDRLASLECQHHDGRLSDDEYLELSDEATAQLRRHRFALFRLGEKGRN